jgi:hypothetical protein
LAGTITGAAIPNILQAAMEAGINDERILDALVSVPYTVTWNDGGLTGSAAELRNAMRDAGVAVGIPEAQMDLFVTRIIAIDTGLTGNVTAMVPNMVGKSIYQAWLALEKAGLRCGAITMTADRGDIPIGQVSAQNPAANAADAPGSLVALTAQKGQTVPDVADETADAAIDAIEAALLAAGNLGANIAGTAEADDDIVTTTNVHGLVAGDRVWLRSLTGGTGLTQGLLYYIRDVSTTKKFKVALTEGGTAINIEADATAIVFNKLTATIVDPGEFAADDAVVSTPAAGTFQNPATPVTFTLGGVEVPAWDEEGEGTDGVFSKAEFESACTSAGLVGVGTGVENAAAENDVLTVSKSGFVQNGSAVAFTYSTGPGEE